VFDVVMPEVEEIQEGEPEQVVVENARRKARAVMSSVGAGATVLGADTEVVLDGRLLGKAADEIEARSHLESLSGSAHEVLGGLVLLTVGGGERSGVAETSVTFKQLDEATLDLYISSGEWRDRAGAYAIQGLGSILVERVEGDLSNVVGLPVRLLLDLAPELVASSGPRSTCSNP
jgi:septum formation protein